MHKSSILNDLKELWRKLTIDRASAIVSYFRNPADRRAYLGYYFPVYVAKIVALLDRLDKESHLDSIKNKPLRVLDLGSGTLTAIAAVEIFFQGAQIEAQAVDKSLAPMRLGLKVLNETIQSAATNKIFLKQANLFGPKTHYLPKWKPNLIILGHVINEMGQGPRAREQAENLIQTLMSELDEDGLLLIVEPASQVTTRFLMSLRDRLVRQEQCEVLAPCTGAEDCPLIEIKKSWCFSEFNWQRPKEFEKIDHEVGFRRETLKSSYLLLAKSSPSKNQLLRIVSGPMEQGRIMRRYICTEQGRKTLEVREGQIGFEVARKSLRGELLNLNDSDRDKVRIYTES